MVEIADIVDKDSLRDWLKRQPKEVSAWIARRAAMRVFPIYWEWLATSKSASEPEMTVVPILRFYLISEVTRKIPTSAALIAAYTAAISSSTAASGAGYNAASSSAAISGGAGVIAALNAATAVGVATDASLVNRTDDAAPDAAHAFASNAYLAPIHKDCCAIEESISLDKLALWSENENPLADVWGQVKAKLHVHSSSRPEETARGTARVDWSFWIKWYDSVLAGEPLNGDMLKEIALIDAEEWEKGAGVVNPLIADIVAKYEMEPKGDLTPQQALSQNAKAVIAQLEALKTFVEEEIQRIRSPNNISDAEQEQIRVRVVALQSIIEAIKKMVTALVDDDQSSENALVVIGEQLPKVINEAEKMAEQEPEISEIIVVMSATVEHLTKRGVPGHVATGLAITDLIFRPIKKWFKRDKKSKA